MNLTVFYIYFPGFFIVCSQLLFNSCELLCLSLDVRSLPEDQPIFEIRHVSLDDR